jgi:hypothetical protein
MKINQKILLASCLSAILLFSVIATSQAAIENPVIGDLGTSDGVEDGSKFLSYTVYLWRVSINLGALAVIVFFVWGAFEWITAGSDSKKTETARGRMTNAVIGLIVLVSSFTLLSFISKIFFGENFDLLKLTFPTRTEQSTTPTNNYGGSPPGNSLNPPSFNIN